MTIEGFYEKLLGMKDEAVMKQNFEAGMAFRTATELLKKEILDKQVLEYNVVRSAHLDKLIQQVNSMKDWDLFGATQCSDGLWFQTLTRLAPPA